MAATKYWRRQNIGTYKTLALTICWCRRNIGMDKMFASKKYLHRKNIRADKILALTKFWRRQNLGVKKACAEAFPYCFGPAESVAADFSQTSLMFSYFSLKMLISPRAVTKCAVAAGRLAFMCRLFPALYRLIVLAGHAQNVTNIGTCKDFTNFAKL